MTGSGEAKKNRADVVVLVSGGLDSAVTAAIAAQAGRRAFLHANYGQKTEERELKAFYDIADHYGVTERLVVDLSYLKAIGGSALTDVEIEVPEAELDSEEIPVTYLPFRNANLLSVAVSWAEALGAGAVYIGAVEEDGSGYPDCRAEFLESFERTAGLGTRPETEIKIKAPLIAMKKAEIIRLGTGLRAPFHLTWSCYGQSEPACGLCDSCQLRLRGFKEASMEDPISYSL